MSVWGAIKEAVQEAVNAVKSLFSCNPTSPIMSCSSGTDFSEAEKEEIKKALENQTIMLQEKKKELENWDKADEATKENFKKWFGNDDEESRKTIQERIDKMIELNKNTTIDNFKKADPDNEDCFAYVYPNDKSHTIYIGKQFSGSPETGRDSTSGTLCHEMSHFSDIGGTEDHVYGTSKAANLAKTNPEDALTNADSFEYYMENAK